MKTFVSGIFFLIVSSGLLNSSFALQSGGVEYPSDGTIGRLPEEPFKKLPIESAVKFEWRMEDRFGDDYNDDGRIDIPNTYAYVNNTMWRCGTEAECENFQPRYNVYFDASGSYFLQRRERLRASPLPITNYRFEIVGASRHFVRDQKSPKLAVPLEEGDYWVGITITSEPFAGSILSEKYHEIITIKDILFIAMGDSYASGEGNPEKSVIKLDELEFPLSALNIQLNPFLTGMRGIPIWADAGEAWNTSTEQHINHWRSHRSMLAWPAQVALALEQSDPHTSVTFVFVAATGATIKKGLLGEYKGGEGLLPPLVYIDPLLSDSEAPPPPLVINLETINPALHGTAELTEDHPLVKKMPSQIDQVREMIGGTDQQIDVITLSVGGNDIGFANVIKALLKRVSDRDDLLIGDLARTTNFDDIQKAIETGDWDDVLAGALWPVEDSDGLSNLGALYRDLHEGLETLNLCGSHIFFTEYPDPTQHAVQHKGVQYCSSIGGDIFRFRDRHIDWEEGQWVVQNFLQPLNQKIQLLVDGFNIGATDAKGGRSHSSHFISGISQQFRRHGYCANAPYPPYNYPGNRLIRNGTYPTDIETSLFYKGLEGIRWLRTETESLQIQNTSGGVSLPGIVPDTAETKGLMHPNEIGHQAIMRLVFKQMTDIFNEQ